MRRHRCRVGRSGWCEGIRHECQCNLQPMHSEAVRALVTTLRCHVRNVAKLDARTILLTVHQERDCLVSWCNRGLYSGHYAIFFEA